MKGNRITLNTWDFHGADERLLVIDNIGLVDNRFVFQGPGIDTANPGKYVDVANNWKLGAGSTNSIRLINTTTGAEADLINQAY